ncbi:unnamed protein product [Coregonus sp. 'balchen']|nr:unnamed protein product [Coregonus sp. 'balchen']
MDFRWGRSRGVEGIAVVIDFLLANARLVMGVGGAAVLGIATLAVKRLIERAGRAAEDEKVEQKMSESWEELSLVSASPKAIRKGLEGVVMKHITKATKATTSEPCIPRHPLSINTINAPATPEPCTPRRQGSILGCFPRERKHTASTTSEYLNFMRGTEASYLETLEAQHQQQDQHFNQLCEDETAASTADRTARATEMAKTASFNNSFIAVFG